MNESRAFLKISSRILMAMTVSLLIMISCGGDKSTQENKGTLITPAGGIVTEAGGVTLIIPAGAVTQNVYIKTRTYHDHALIPIPAEPALNFDCAALLEPNGLTFQVPITIIFPAGRNLTPGAQFPIFYYDETDECWKQSDSLSTVAADGRSFSAQIDHFSIWGGDGRLDENGLFDNLEQNLGSGSPQQAFSDFITWFRDNFGDIGDKGFYRNECHAIAGMAFDMSYIVNGNNGSLYEQIGETTDHTLIVSYQHDRGDQNGDFYFDIQVTIYIRCTAPEVSVEAVPASISDGESSDITARLTCGGTAMPGKRISFQASGPGSIRPTSGTTSPQGEVSAEYTANGEGIATITASHQACANGQPVTASGQTQISVGSWRGTLVASFNHHHDDPYWDFNDVVTIEFSFSASNDSVIGSGNGSHNASLAVGHPCAVISSSAANFPTTVFGTSGSGYVDIVFSSYNAIEYPVTFTLQCDDYIVPVPEYGPLVSYVIAMDIRPHIALQDGAQASGSGSEYFGETWPMQYSYTLTLHR